MAEYTNLTSLQGLQTGDKVTYNTTTAIDFKGYKVKVEIYGLSTIISGDEYSKGGYVSFVINSSILPNKILSFNNSDSELNFVNVSTSRFTPQKRCDLIYGNTSDLYYRISVAGNAGYYGYKASNKYYGGGAGGGITGAVGTKTGDKISYPYGGSQTSGGRAGQSNNNQLADSGAFGKGGAGHRYSSYAYGGDGGYGWYGGGGASSSEAYGTSGGGGGSGFIIGVSTTTYPSGYLGNNSTLQSTIASAISEGSLVQGGSSSTTPKMILTIIETESPSTSNSQLQYFKGTEFIKTDINYYNGTEFILCDAYYYDGTEFKKV